jgi:hypothetical protein
VADAIRDWHNGCGAKLIRVPTMPARHGLRTRPAVPAQVNRWLAQTMRRTGQRVLEEGDEDGES